MKGSVRRNSDPTASTSQIAAKRSAGITGPSGISSKNDSASLVVDRAVAQRRVSAGIAGRRFVSSTTL